MTEGFEGGSAEAREKRPTYWKGAVFVAAVLAAAAGLGVFALSQRSPEGPLVPKAEPAPIAVEIQEVSIGGRFTLTEQFSGLASARRTSMLGFTNGGRVERIAADVGDVKKAGARLATLDTRALRAQLAAAEASVEEARAAHALAQVTVRRQADLLAKGHVSPQRLDEAKAQAETSAARIEAARAQADLLQVQIDLASIEAPFDGVVVARMMDEGAIAGQGQAVFEFVEAGAVEARIGLPAAAAAKLKVGETYTLTLAGAPVDATLRAVTGVIDDGRRTVDAVFDVPAAAKATPGAVARLAVARELDERGFWAPVSALLESKRGLWSVYVVEAAEGGGFKTAPRLVEIVHSEGGRAYVRGAVESGERIVVDGLQRLAPGQSVSPTMPDTASYASGR